MRATYPGCPGIPASLSLLLVGLMGCPTPTGDDDDSTAMGDDDDDPVVDCETLWEVPGGGGTFYEQNPTYEDPVDDSDDWTFSAPEDQGMDGARLDQAAGQLEALPYFWSFLVLRHGVIVAEHYFNGAEAGHSNNVHSSSKSLLGVLTGIAIEEGHVAGIDQALSELLPGHFDAIDDPAKASITVGHLMTMTAGFEWTEDATEYQIENEPDWVQAILDLPLAQTPGEVFNYSTGQTHVLGAALAEATGMSTCQYAHQALLGPLGNVAEHWGRDPQGYFSGGCNVYMTPRELARFGLLVGDGGQWRGAQLIPADWVDAAVSAQADAGYGYSYGYLFWLTTIRGHAVAIAWGWGGQLVYVVRDLDLVVVFTTNTRDFAPDYDGFDILRDHVIPAVDGT